VPSCFRTNTTAGLQPCAYESKKLKASELSYTTSQERGVRAGPRAHQVAALPRGRSALPRDNRQLSTISLPALCSTIIS